MLNIAILGSTGSIGSQTLQVLEYLPEYKVYGLSAHQNIKVLADQVHRWQPRKVVIGQAAGAAELKNTYNIAAAWGDEGLCELASDPNVDLVVNALVGFAGLRPTLAALKAGKKVALANKEVLVTAGQLVMEYGSQIVPIDSEHSAIWQILAGRDRKDISSLVLTASGGPFWQKPADLRDVNLGQALQHPNWSMGKKITIDSATLMNKGLEVIEAHWLFGLGYDQIEVVIHPQSIIHSMVRFKDGSLMAQMGVADMRLPIQYALTFFSTGHFDKQLSLPLNLAALDPLTFAEHDPVRFPCLNLAYHAGKIGGSLPVVLNAANEIAVNLFIEGKIGFTDIPQIVSTVLNKHRPVQLRSLDQLFHIDEQARALASGEARLYR